MTRSADHRLALTATAYTIPTDAPEADGTLSWDRTTLVLVEAATDGSTGVGWTYGPAATAAVVAETLLPALDGLDPDDVPACWHAMVVALRNVGRPGVGGLALSAVDCALWDLKAARVGVPLADLFGRARDRVPVYGSGGFTTYDLDREHRQLAGWAGDGLPAVKIKIGERRGTAVERDLERVRVARRAVGPDVELFVDANGAYTRKQAARVWRAAADCDVRWFEEPVTSDDLVGLAQVRSMVDADVAAGEYGYDLAYLARMAPAVDCLQADATRCGGFTEWRRAAAVAAGAHVGFSAHCAPYLHLPAALATTDVRHLEYFHDHVRIERLLFDGTAEPHDGCLEATKEPGIGVRFRHADARPYRVA